MKGTRWTPVDQALYEPEYLLDIEVDKAKELRLNAIKYAFQYHYENSPFYGGYCREQGITPKDIKSPDDLVKIPLIPDHFFKSYPNTKEEFKRWLQKIYTGSLPAFSNVDELPSKGVELQFSSGTSGKNVTIVPRDGISRRRNAYVTEKCFLELAPYEQGMAFCVPVPKFPRYSFAGVALNIYKHIFETVLGGETIWASGEELSLTGVVKEVKLNLAETFDEYVYRLKEVEHSGSSICLFGIPGAIFPLLFAMKKHHTTFKFSGFIWTGGGGWKLPTGEDLEDKEGYYNMLAEQFGLKRHMDVYGGTEYGVAFSACEGGFIHYPQSVYEIRILDEKLNPIGYNSYGRVAFWDPLSNNYPGFIVTGDKAMLLEHCPVCSRPGRVLSPEIARMPGAETRGCGEAVRRTLSQ